MPTYSELITTLDENQFAKVLAASSRKKREEFFARLGIRAAKTASRSLNPGEKNKARVQVLRKALSCQTGEQIGEEMLRLYLLQHRPLLAAGLDFFGIAHEQGLSNSDEVLQVGRLSGAKQEEFKAYLKEKTQADDFDVDLYLHFMRASAYFSDLADSQR